MRRFFDLTAFLLLLTPAVSTAQVNSGVSDERVTLPQTAGAISGVGENASIEGNHGAVQYSVKVEAPAGFAGLTPNVSLGYSSQGGASVLGMGWSMATSSIERMTSQGLEKYALTDRFAVDGAQELVQVAQSSTSAVYRARFEGGFVRYTWLARGTGEGGYWTAEYPDGSVGYYGADSTGTAVPTAEVIVPSTARVFAWHLVVLQDAWGHQLKLNWTKDSSGYPLLERMDYLFEGTLPRHSVRFTYEPRLDPLSDARPGFELVLTQRLKDVRVFSGTTAPEQIRRYALTYEDDATAGGVTRLKSVSRFGRGDVAYPVTFSFAYSQTLGGACTTNCDKPFAVDMGVVSGVDFSTGRALLVDLNGDALPDVVFSDAQGVHHFVYGKLDSEGKASFTSTPVASMQTVGSSPFILGLPQVQLFDVNGDGFVDLTESRAHQVLCNNGSGDWVAGSFCSSTAPNAPAAFTNEDPSDAPVQQDPLNVRFFDYDNDKRIDWLRSSSDTSSEVLANTPGGFVQLTVDPIGATFDASPLQLADMNGDGLQDPVQVLVSGSVVVVQYKLNLGFGHWSPTWRTLSTSGFNASQAAALDLEDINGDGLADLIAVTGNEVAIALNRNGTSYAPLLSITSANLGSGTIPARTSTTTVTYADMNGNGSEDIVWFQPNGDATYLELFPVRPNLIARIDNGLGSVQTFTYGTSIAQQARDTLASLPWANRVPNASVVVTRTDSYVSLTGTASGGLHEIVTYRYHSGYYDGAEKQFRGYEGVDQELLADLAADAREPGVVVLDFDVGQTNPALAGKTRKRSVYSTATSTRVLLREDRNLFDLCTVAEVPPTASPAVVFACERATTSIRSERDPAHAVTLRVERDYDGYGNVTAVRNLGVTNGGTPEQPTACEACVASGIFGQPCGMTCEGDEQFTQTGWITPGPATGGAWLTRRSRTAMGAVATTLPLEQQFFYDGPDFQGLAAGQLTRGALTRVARRSGPGPADFLDVERLRRDPGGNVLEAIDADGTPTGEGHRRRYQYEPAGLWATRVEAKVNATTSLVVDLVHDPIFEGLAQQSNWYPVVSGQPAATPQQTRFRYDEHGRNARLVRPGDTDAVPSAEYVYELADPVSRVVRTEHAAASGAADLVVANCFDGRGRLVQSRQQVSGTTWLVSGFIEFDARGADVREYLPYLATSGACETTAPTTQPFRAHKYDVEGRLLKTVDADGSTRRYEYAPLATRFFDELSNDPVIETKDGLGRLTSIARSFTAGGTPAVTRLEYDLASALTVVRDPAGNAHTQVIDPLGRVTKVTDVNSGVTGYEYDAVGNQTRRTDARGRVLHTDFDGLNRVITEYDEAAADATRVSWTWDVTTGCTECTNAGGQVAQVDWKNGETAASQRFGYDTHGNRVFAEQNLDGHAMAIRSRYDNADRLVSTLFPAGINVDRTLDGASRIASLPNYVTQLTYGDRGQLSTMTSANGVHSDFGYDARVRLASVHTVAADGADVLALTLGRKPNGLISTITDASTRTGRARHGATFGYDEADRLLTASLDRDGDPEALTFAYDTLDNVASITSSLGDASPANLGVFTYGSPAVNAVTHAGALDASYDAAGYLATRGSRGFEYDHLGRQTRTTVDGAETATFRFGPEQRRLVKTEGDFTTRYVSPEFELRDGIAVAYAMVGSRRVARIESDAVAATVLSDLAPATGSGTLTSMGNGTIDIADAWLAQAAAAGVVRFNGGPTPSPVKGLLASAARRLLMKDVVFLHDDHLGSVVAATDGKGALVGERSFTPTGLERSRGGFVDTYGFTGQEHDQSGLIHFQYRDLDPHLARWTSVDPAFQVVSPASATRLGQATGGYAYVGNDFTNNTDPTGLLFGKAISKLKARLKRSKSSSKYSNHEGESHAQAWLSDLHEQNDVYKAHPIDSEYQSYVPSPAASEYANVPIVSEYANVSEVTKGSSANFSPLKAEYVNASKLEISSTEFGRGSSGASGPPSLDPPPLTLAQGIEAVRRTAWMGGPPPGPVRPIERPASHTYERTPTLAHEVPIYNNVSEATVRARSNTVDYQNEDL